MKCKHLMKCMLMHSELSVGASGRGGRLHWTTSNKWVEILKCVVGMIEYWYWNVTVTEMLLLLCNLMEGSRDIFMMVGER